MITKEKEELIDSVGIIYSQLKKKADTLKIAKTVFSEKIRMKYYWEHGVNGEKQGEELFKWSNEEARKTFHPTEEEKKKDEEVLQALYDAGVIEEEIQERLDSVYPFDWIIRKRENLKQITVNGYELWKLMSELHLIAKQLGEPIDSPKVCLAYSKKHEGLPNDLADFVINPIYFAPEECYFYTEPGKYVDPDFYEKLQKEAISKEIVEYVKEHYPE